MAEAIARKRASYGEKNAFDEGIQRAICKPGTSRIALRKGASIASVAGMYRETGCEYCRATCDQASGAVSGI
jgi:hypothetical protein